MMRSAISRIGIILLALALTACASRAPRGAQPQPMPMPPQPMMMPASYIPEMPSSGSLWNQEPESLFGNRRARTIGDILTVIVEINDEAEIDNEVDRSRSSNDNFSAAALLGLTDVADSVLPGSDALNPGVDYNRNRNFQGSGSIRREDRITLRLAARVIDQLPNGYLVIEGQQEVRVNHDVRVLRAQGIVRPEDISRSNTVPHDRIAEAKIGYVGEGAIDAAIKPRAGNRIFNWIVPF